MPVIQNPEERKQRAEQKRHALLRFLRDELYTTPAVAGEVMQCGERAARQTIASMEKFNLVRRHVLQVLPGLPPITLVAITSHGQAMTFNPDAGEEVNDRVFEVGGYSLVYLSHKLDTQRLRLQAMQSGRVTKWLPGETLGMLTKNVKRPDAVLLTADKVRVAVEIERTIKNKKRYAAILASHLTAIKQNKWNRVVWTSPDANISHRLEAILKCFKRCDIAGIDTVLTEQHFKPLAFCTYTNFINQL